MSRFAYNLQYLRDISLAYMNTQEDFIARKVAPAVNVVKESAKILSYGADSIRIVNTVRAVGGNSNQVELTTSDATAYFLEDHAVHDYISREDYDNADLPQQPQVDTFEHLAQLLMVAEEYAVATVVQTAGNYASTNKLALSGGARWSDYTNSNPIKNILDAVSAVRGVTGKIPNTMVLPFDVMMTLLSHPKILDRFPGASVVTIDMIKNAFAALFGVSEILVGKAIYNSAAKGATLDIGDMWTNTCALFYREQKPTLKSRTFMTTYSKRDEEMVPDLIAYQGSKDKELVDRKADFARLGNKYDTVLTDANCGYLFTTVLTA